MTESGSYARAREMEGIHRSLDQIADKVDQLRASTEKRLDKSAVAATRLDGELRNLHTLLSSVHREVHEYREELRRHEARHEALTERVEQIESQVAEARGASRREQALALGTGAAGGGLLGWAVEFLRRVWSGP